MPLTSSRRRNFVFASVLAGMFMTAVETTIISTAMPQIAGQLGDIHLYPWVFSAFLLSQCATTMVFGNLADIYGRKPVLLVCIGIFLVASLFCGFAWSMTSLVAFRLLQGIGAGGIQPICVTLVGDLYSLDERPKIQGYLSGVWAGASVVGPLAGSLIIGHLGWPWIFWINIPVGALAFSGFALFMHEDIGRAARQPDVAGAVFFTVAVAAVIICSAGNLGQSAMLIALVIFFTSSILFILQERRAADPMISLRLWKRRIISVCNSINVIAAMPLIGLTAFLPMYVQGVMGRSALEAGFAVTAIVFGWPSGAMASVRLFPRIGLRGTVLTGALLMPVGGCLFLLLTPSSPLLLAGIGSFIIGTGMGFLANSTIIIAQTSVEWRERASATAAILFSRSLGSTLGAALFGAILNATLADGGEGEATYDKIRALLENHGSADLNSTIHTILDQSLHVTFIGVFAVSMLVVMVAAFLPRIDLDRRKQAMVIAAAELSDTNPGQ